MDCYHCNTKLIWGGDHDTKWELYTMVTNLTCPKCDSFFLVYTLSEKPRNKAISEYRKNINLS